MRQKSYWAALEAGIITGPDSKVERIWRCNKEEVQEGQALPRPTLAWSRELHEPFGKRIDGIDWRINLKPANMLRDVPDDSIEARPKVQV